MSIYLLPLKTALVAFPVVALVLALPFLVAQYRRYGSLVWWRAVVVYTFVFYLLSAYFLIILPLPSRAAVATLVSPRANLVPFNALREFLASTVFSPLHPATWLPALKQPWFIQPAFNVVLTIPFGVYLRYYFKRPLWQVWLMSLGLSLFFELTQLSGLYGYYPRPYRMFDVHDLMLNSFGGWLGGLIAPALMRAFPSREDMDARARQKGQRVTWTRRFVAWLIDNTVVLGLVTAATSLLFHLLGWDAWTRNLQLSTIVPLVIVFGFIPVVTGGTTPGKALVRIRIVRANGQPASAWRLLWREFLLYGVALQLLRGFLWSFTELFSKFHRTEINFVLLAGFGVPLAFVVINFLWELLTRDNRYFYDVWADTTQISTTKNH